jgi:hypothetical protein
VFVAIDRVERHIQILGWLSVHQHFSVDGIKGRLCRWTALFREYQRCPEREHQPERQEQHRELAASHERPRGAKMT